MKKPKKCPYCGFIIGAWKHDAWKCLAKAFADIDTLKRAVNVIKTWATAENRNAIGARIDGLMRTAPVIKLCTRALAKMK